MEHKQIRFWSKASLTADPSRCWEWQGFRRRNNYGQSAALINGKLARIAHRIAFYYYFGVDPGKLCVLHACDNPPCVNPHHLRLGTHDENVADQKSKGRTCTGMKNGRTKLTVEDVHHIRSRGVSDFQTGTAIAKELGVTFTTVHNIQIGKVWKGVE